MENLKNIKTCELVAELKKREGVVEILAEPYVKKRNSNRWSCHTPCYYRLANLLITVGTFHMGG